MTWGPQYDFITTELDPDLLSTSFGIQTNWHLLDASFLPAEKKAQLKEILDDYRPAQGKTI